MFNRGKTAPDMYPKVEALIGDRNGELGALKGRDWDAVIDNSGFFPRHAQLSAELLHGHVGQYMFVSSISAYGDNLAITDDEITAPPAEMDGPVDEAEHIYGPTYGARKRLCEEEVNKVFGEDAIIVRPGIITGIGDPTERLRHWLRRMVAGNEILVPGQQDLPVQYIDAADMCAWMVRMLESGNGSGPYNAVGAAEPYRARPLLEALARYSGSLKRNSGSLARCSGLDASSRPLTRHPGEGRPRRFRGLIRLLGDAATAKPCTGQLELSP
jgi:2'-hydroxyisoflavone reductase